MLVSGSGSNECSTSSDCLTYNHNECAGTTCISVSGSGTDKCFTNSDCITQEHAKCENYMCVISSGPGAYECSPLSDDCSLPPVNHNECVGGTCMTVSGSGSNECSTSSDCTGPPAHTECKNNVCKEVSGDGVNQCSPLSDDCALPPSNHNVCVDETCTLVNGAGSDECSTSSDCIIQEHTKCENAMCVISPGPGVYECSPLTNDCAFPPLNHNTCVGETCMLVSGSGTNECSTSSDCSNQNPGHTKCNNDMCVEVAGDGVNECSPLSDDCVIPSPNHNECVDEACMLVSGSGTNECSASSDCIVTSECTLTSAFWGANQTIAGTNVDLNVMTSGCEGKQISFEVFRNVALWIDSSCEDITGCVLPSPVDVGSNRLVIGTWTAGPMNLDNKYYFVAKVVGTSVELESDDNRLNVTDFVIGQCGDGHADINEECDDGNTANGDGCSETCTLESGDCNTNVLCNGTDLKGRDCTDFGFYSPNTLSCTSSCEFDTSQCSDWIEELSECEVNSYYCSLYAECFDAGGIVLDEYSCIASIQSCCDVQPLSETCAEKGGGICSSNQQCIGGTAIGSSDVYYPELCCYGGYCEDYNGTGGESECESNGGICRLGTCNNGEDESYYFCSSSDNLCCIQSTIAPEKSSSSWWIWLLLILIIILVFGIIFRNKVRELLFRVTSKGKTKPGSSLHRPMMMPTSLRPLPQGQLIRRPLPPGQLIRRVPERKILPPTPKSPPPKKEPSKLQLELEEVLKKLKELAS